MFNYIINWDKVIKENLPVFFHRLFRLAWITALIKPFKVMHAEFLQLREDYIYKVRFNSEVIYLERLLNDKFDPTGRGIYIEDLYMIDEEYLYRKIESKPDRYCYSKWNSATNYLTSEYSIDGNIVWKALTNHVNSQPTLISTDWEYYKDVTFFHLQGEYNASGGFIVNVPAALTYDDAQMRAVINYYRFASKLFTINLF